MYITDVTAYVHSERNFEDRIVGIVCAVVTLVDKYLIPVLLKAMSTSLHHRVAVGTCNLVVVLIVGSTLHSTDIAGRCCVGAQ